MDKATILIVDDDTTNLSILLDYLNDLDDKVLIAPNGEVNRRFDKSSMSSRF